ncbi:hypothetical protein ATANTOWER_023102 [Ataeniobius toweri]|uniref:Uncharacterized protein n=1 Tax=Ataeniobius toweri TaxID=208326 RepID=A0ABU7CCZ2_9TELE|nr:hypothetical protein [Ataeniobius toweri]
MGNLQEGGGWSPNQPIPSVCCHIQNCMIKSAPLHCWSTAVTLGSCSFGRGPYPMTIGQVVRRLNGKARALLFGPALSLPQQIKEAPTLLQMKLLSICVSSIHPTINPEQDIIWLNSAGKDKD